MANDIAPVFEMRPDIYRDEDHSSITELSRAMQLEGAKLSSVVTHMTFTDKNYAKRNFPILYSTEGLGRIHKVPNFDYTYPILGRPKTSSQVGKSIYSTGDEPGKNRGIFYIYFKDKFFAEQQTLNTKGGVSVRVQRKPVKEGAFYKFAVQLWETSSTKFCPLNVLTAGTVWSGGAFKAPFEDGRGVESRSYLGGTAKNMTSLLRKGYKLKGNVQNKIMLYTIKAEGQTFQYYCDWEMYLAGLYFAAQQELEMWVSSYGRDANGEFIMTDEESGKGITSNGGIEQQIPNKRQFSELTYRRLVDAIRDVTFNVQDETAEIDLVTGTGGMEEIDEVLKNELKDFTLVDSRMAQGEGWDLVYGGFFKAFRHRDGMMVNIIKNPMFDRGYIGDVEDIHPKSGLPKSSHNIYLLDKTVYDGEPNFKYVIEEGREFVEWTVMGSIVPKGFTATDSRASDRDSSSVHGQKSLAIQIMKPTGCLKLDCVIGNV